MAVSCMCNASGHSYRNSPFIVDLAMGQILRSTDRISSFSIIWSLMSFGRINGCLSVFYISCHIASCHVEEFSGWRVIVASMFILWCSWCLRPLFLRKSSLWSPWIPGTRTRARLLNQMVTRMRRRSSWLMRSSVNNRMKPVHQLVFASYCGYIAFVLCLSFYSSLSFNRQHLSYEVCLEVRGEIIRTVLCCIVYWTCAQS